MSFAGDPGLVFVPARVSLPRGGEIETGQTGFQTHVQPALGYFLLAACSKFEISRSLGSTEK